LAEQALPPGAIRRRAVFGLLDADGWGWAGIKATWWFLVIIFLLGYVPNLAYYFTVGTTIDVGYNAISIVNFCDAGNKDLPCPAPAGAMTPWQPNPAELTLPAGRAGALAVQSGTHLYLVGGTTASGPSADVLATNVSADGNLEPWAAGPALPEARTGAALATLSGVPYIIGGLDGSGKPTTTVLAGVVKEGVLTGWTMLDGSTAGAPNLTLPAALSDASAVAASNGLYVFGGRTADGLSRTVWHSKLSTATPPVLASWAEVTALPLPEARADATATLVGNFLYVVGGEGPSGITDTVFRLQLQGGDPAADFSTRQLIGWATPNAGQPGNLTSPRAHATSFTANGALYVVGGVDASNAPQATNFWAVPDATIGDIAKWQELKAADLPAPRAGAAIAPVGSVAFLIGGAGPAGPVDTTFRGGLSPKPPFFKLGMFGATIPALSLKGEIGQQLGYINAFGVGMTNFLLLVIVGIAYSHKAATMRMIERLSRGRFRAPRSDEYGGSR
jgi:N-acetylneuraminic acid mutarotase